MSIIGNIGEYNEAEEDFENYCTRVELFFAANSVDDDKKACTFLTLLGAKTFSLVKDLVAPKTPTGCTYKELVDALKAHYKPQIVIIFERFKFYSRNQENGESVANFVAAIKAKARTCDFGSHLDDMLRDRLVMGLKDQDTQRALLTAKDLTFSKAVETAFSREAAAKDVKAIGSNSSNSSNHSINTINPKGKYSKKGKPKFSSQANVNKSVGSPNNSKYESKPTKPNQPCMGCGNSHWKKDCPFKKAECRKCKKIGHIAKVCFSKTNTNLLSSEKTSQSSTLPNNNSKVVPNMPRSEYLYYNDGSINTISPYMLDVEVNGVVIPFELDTGAARTVMSKSIFENTFAKAPELKPSNLILRKYGDMSIPICGEATVSVSLNGKTNPNLSLVVVNESGPTLLGRDWMKSLKIPINNIELKGSNIQNISEDSMDSVDEFPSFIDTSSVGNLKDVQISKEGAIPKYYKAKPIYPTKEKKKAKQLYNRKLEKDDHTTLQFNQGPTLISSEPIKERLKPSDTDSGVLQSDPSLILQSYHFDLVHCSGKLLGSADTLSRLPLPCKNECVPIPAEWIDTVEFMENTPVTAKDIAMLTKKDPILSKVLNFCMNGWPDKVESNLIPFKNRYLELSVQSDCILWGHRIVIPNKVRHKLMEELHAEHMGSSKMKELARKYFWWPGLDGELESLIKSCPECLENRDFPKKSPLHPWEWPSVPWHRIHIDYAGPINNTYYLVVVDAHSKWVEIFPTQTITSKATIALLRSCFARFGLPVVLVSDNGTCFTSNEFQTFVQMNGIRHVCSAPFHPSTNGLAENMVRTFKSALRHVKGEEVRLAIDRFLFKYRLTPHTTTGLSPSELLIGRRIRSVFDLLRPNETVQQRVWKNQQKQKFNHDPKSPRFVELVPNDPVRVRNYSHGPKWIPATVEAKTGPVSYKVTTNDGIEMRRHQDQIWTSKPLSPEKANSEADTPQPSSPAVRRSTRISRAPERLDL